MPIAPPIRAKLEKLPKSSATWCLGSAVVDPEVTAGEVQTLLMCTQGDGMPRSQSVLPRLATEADWCKLLVTAMEFAPAGSRAMVPKIIKVADAALVSMLQALVAPLKIKVEQVDTPLVVARWLAVHAAPSGENPPSLVLERATWAALQELHDIGPLEEDNEDYTFAMTTDLPGWETAQVVWTAEKESGPGGDLYIVKSRGDLDTFLADSDAAKVVLEQTMLTVYFYDLEDGAELIFSRAALRGLPHAGCHVPVLNARDPGKGAARGQLDATETALLQLVAKGIAQWCAWQDGGDAVEEEPDVAAVFAIPDTTATIAWIDALPEDQHVPAISWSWLLALRCELVNGEAQLVLLVPAEVGDQAMAELEDVDGLILQPSADAADDPDECTLFGLVATGEPVELSVVRDPPLPSAGWMWAAAQTEWLLEVVVCGVTDMAATHPTSSLPVVGTRLMPVAWAVGI